MPDFDEVERRLRRLDDSIGAIGSQIALHLVVDRPDRIDERPGLSASAFAERCLTDLEIDRFVEAFRSIGAAVEVFDGEVPFIEAVAARGLRNGTASRHIVYNGLESGTTPDGFAPGRRSLIPAVADAFGLTVIGQNAHACALARHKFQWSTLLRSCGLPVPRTWHFSPRQGWCAGQHPEPGTKVIVKSTYESWSVGVTRDSVFVADDRCTQRVASLARRIAQPVTVQEFVSGAEVSVPLFCDPDRFTTPPIQRVVERAPDDPEQFITLEDNLTQGAVTARPFVSELAAERLAEVTTSVFEVLGFDGCARIDFRVSDAGEVWVTDVAADPGVTPLGATTLSVAQIGIDHASFLRAMVGASLASGAAR
jgi:D-alanine-D-alanine ligase